MAESITFFGILLDDRNLGQIILITLNDDLQYDTKGHKNGIKKYLKR